TEKQRELVEIEKALATVDRTPEIGVQGRVDIALLRSQVKDRVAALKRGLRERERDGLPAWLRRRAVRHVGVRRQTRLNSASAHHEHPVVVSAARSHCSCNARSDVGGRVEPL